MVVPCARGIQLGRQVQEVLHYVYQLNNVLQVGLPYQPQPQPVLP